MANPERGEVSIDIGGTSYTLAPSINAIIKVEAMFSKAEGRKVTWSDVLKHLNAGSMEHKRAVFWATLLKYHPDVTIEQAGDLSDVLDRQLGSNAALVDAVTTGAPDPADVKELGAGRPPRAQRKSKTNGIGANSTSRLASSV